MGKRSDFERKPRDLYETPPEAVAPLLRHLAPGTRFIEPCAGAGALVDALEAAGHVCVGAFDIVPLRAGIAQRDVMGVVSPHAYDSGCHHITNPPWKRPILHSILKWLPEQHPTWLLFDASWAFTKQAARYLPRCRKIVAIGRVQWEPGTNMTGKDDAAWYLFERNRGDTVFFGRGE